MMTLQSKMRIYNVFKSALRSFLCAALPFFSVGLLAQTSPTDHLEHHPPPVDSATNDISAAPDSTATSDPMAGMIEMMREMLAPPQKQLYPSLMEMPELTDEKRLQLQAAAQERLQSGLELMSEGMANLGESVSTNDYRAMQNALTLMHEAIARFESGISAQQALAEKQPPQDVALQWFKQEMNLPQAPFSAPPTDIFGMSRFHVGIMALLVFTALGFLWLNFLRMKRSSLLLRELTGTKAGETTTSSVKTSKQVNDTPINDASSGPLQGKKAWSGQLRVGRIMQETPDVKTFRLMNPLGGVLPFTYLPGQFVTISLPVDGKPVRRSYTIASSPTQHDYLELTIKHSLGGLVSGHLFSDVHESDLLELTGPSGSFVFTGRECKCILLLAGGVGITPLMSVLRYLLDRSWDGEIFLIYGCRTPADIIFREELEYLQRRHTNLRVVISVSEAQDTEWKGPIGHITKELIVASVPNLASRYVHICGPVPMMEATKKILAELNVPAARIKTEAFGPAIGKVERPPIEDKLAGDAGKNLTGDAIDLLTATFVDSNKTVQMPADKILLDAAEEIGVDIDYSCRVGTCGACRVKLLSGEVKMAVEDGLQPGDKEANIILACQATAVTDITVKA